MAKLDKVVKKGDGKEKKILQTYFEDPKKVLVKRQTSKK